MSKVSIASQILQIARDLEADYPETQPNEQERKKWREEAEERRRKDGIRPRKSAEMSFRVQSADMRQVVLMGGEYPFESWDQRTSLERLAKQSSMIDEFDDMIRMELNLMITRTIVTVGWLKKGEGKPGEGSWIVNVILQLKEVPRERVDDKVMNIAKKTFE